MRAVLFDAVGTLIELSEPVGETYARAAREAGVDLSPHRVQDAFAATHRAMAPMVFADADPAERPALERSWWRTLVRRTFTAAGAAISSSSNPSSTGSSTTTGRAAAWRTRRGAGALLESLRRRGLRTGMVSNFDHRLWPLLESLGLAPLLDTVVAAGRRRRRQARCADFRTGTATPRRGRSPGALRRRRRGRRRRRRARRRPARPRRRRGSPLPRFSIGSRPTTTESRSADPVDSHIPRQARWPLASTHRPGCVRQHAAA